MVKPYMGLLSDLFSSRVRSEILRLLFSESAAELYVREIVRLSGLSLGTIQQDLEILRDRDLVTTRRDGNRLFYRANKDPLYRDLCNVVSKTAGVIPQLRELLGPFKNTREIEVAFVYGSIAKGKEKALSDVDVMIIGNLGLRGVIRALSGLANQVGREINPHTMTSQEFKKRVNNKDHFLTQVLGQPKTFLIGDESALERLAS
jgi:DNA-binding transcriptional ArsR family regulator